MLIPSVLEPVEGVAVGTLPEPECVQLIFRLLGSDIGRDGASEREPDRTHQH